MQERFGAYVLLERIGHGGMGDVYRARQLEPPRDVALKRLAARWSADASYVNRLRRESEIVFNLEHGHIVPVYDHGEVDGQFYLVMRLIEGEDLADRIGRGGLSADLAVTILSQVASALDFAHRRGVEHRDIKPSNVMLQGTLEPQGTPFAWLMDFGIARLPELAPITEIGEVVGTAAYMAPERIQNAPTSARSDVYSLTCVLFEMLTGRPPYERETAVSLYFAHLQADIPQPSKFGVSNAFDAVIATGMAKNAADRYASAGALAAAARDALDAQTPSGGTTRLHTGPWGRQKDTTPAVTTPVRPRRRRRLVLSTVLAAVVLIGVAALVISLVAGGRGTRRNAGGSSTSGGVTSSSGSAPINPSGSVTRLSSTTSTANATKVGDCLAASLALSPCDATHRYQVFAVTTACTFAGLLSFLGGQPGTDTLLPTVQAQARTVRGTAVCVAIGPANASTGNAQNVLVGPNSGAWRRCYDAMTSKTVSCDRSHTSEYVYSGTPGGATVIDCENKASSYLNSAFADVSDQLSVGKVTGNGSVACIVTVRGGNVLTATLRFLGKNAPPIQQA